MTILMLEAGSPAAPFDRLTMVVAAFLARYRGLTRQHTASDLRCFLAWCAENNLDPLAARRPHLELYLRWMQEARGFKPSTVSRRVSVGARGYRVPQGYLGRSWPWARSGCSSALRVKLIDGWVVGIMGY